MNAKSFRQTTLRDLSTRKHHSLKFPRYQTRYRKTRYSTMKQNSLRHQTYRTSGPKSTPRSAYVPLPFALFSPWGVYKEKLETVN
jgi:hypothetical protein